MHACGVTVLRCSYQDFRAYDHLRIHAKGDFVLNGSLIQARSVCYRPTKVQKTRPFITFEQYSTLFRASQYDTLLEFYWGLTDEFV